MSAVEKMSAAVFEQFAKVLESNVGLLIDPSKDYLLDSRLSPLAIRHGYSGYIDFIKYLVNNPVGNLHWEAFEALLTNETMFFRDRHPFTTLQEVILPNLIEKKKVSRELKIWCAASSTGQEPYSVAMIIRDHFPELLGWKLSFLATDICHHAIAKAKDGIYNNIEVMRGLSQEQITKHLTKLDNNSYQMKQEIRDMIKFELLNLIKDWPSMPKFDLILIRNVLIYFSGENKASIFKRIKNQLDPQSGYLLLGASESILYNPDFQSIDSRNLHFYKIK